ncbi:MAG: glycosyl hydrolase family 15, partial [Dolichospermum sp.]
LDYHFLVDQIRGELAYIQKYWTDLGRPTLTLMITRTMLETGAEALLELMQELKDGICHGVQVKLGKLNQLMLTAAIQKIDFLSDITLSQSSVINQKIRGDYLTSDLQKSWSLGHTQEFQMECETNLNLLLQYLRSSENIYEQIELLQTLSRLQGLEFNTGYA